MDNSANIPFENIGLSKNERKLLSRVVEKQEYATDESFEPGKRLQHYGLIYFTIASNPNATRLKSGAAYVIRKTDRGADFLAYIKQKDREARIARKHDWKIALISGLFGALFSAAINWIATLSEG